MGNYETRDSQTFWSGYWHDDYKCRNNTSLIDTGLTDLYSADDYFNGNWFAIVTSNNRDGQYRRITDYAQSSGTLTVSKAWGAGY